MKTSKLTRNDLSRVKAFYESEFHATLSKLEHIKGILRKLKNVDTGIKEESFSEDKQKPVRTGAKRGPKPKLATAVKAASAKKEISERVAKNATKKSKKITAKKPVEAKAVKKETRGRKAAIKIVAISKKEKAPRTYTHWSKIITKVITDNKSPMLIKEIVASCLKKNKITKEGEVKRAKLSIQNLVYRLKDNNKITVYQAKGDKYQSYGLSGWFKNGVIDEKYLK